ncbi:MAG TPA: hypothetical protein PKK95_02650 [Vicinamibacterales bacterium]|nr:hypothetical protein [Vicinamibacterales bacterium]
MEDALTITMTGRAPVKILKTDWPVIASSRGDSYGGTDGGRHQQALTRGELDAYRLTVRQREDGRTIVYGVLDGAPAWTGTHSRRAGELLDPGDDIAAAIQRVGVECRLPEPVIRACIADLPAEEI